MEIDFTENNIYRFTPKKSNSEIIFHNATVFLTKTLKNAWQLQKDKWP